MPLALMLAQTRQDQREMVRAVEGMGAIMAFIILGIVLIGIVAWALIFSKAGYSWAMVFLMFIPVVNLIWMLIFAFSTWPVQKELEAYRRSGNQQPTGYGPPRY